MLRVLQATGVNMALLHSLRPWANKYHARVVREYPDRFLAVCKLDEPNAHTTQELDNLQMYVRDGDSRDSTTILPRGPTLMTI